MENRARKTGLRDDPGKIAGNRVATEYGTERRGRDGKRCRRQQNKQKNFYNFFYPKSEQYSSFNSNE